MDASPPGRSPREAELQVVEKDVLGGDGLALLVHHSNVREAEQRVAPVRSRHRQRAVRLEQDLSRLELQERRKEHLLRDPVRRWRRGGRRRRVRVRGGRRRRRRRVHRARGVYVRRRRGREVVRMLRLDHGGGARPCGRHHDETKAEAEEAGARNGDLPLAQRAEPLKVVVELPRDLRRPAQAAAWQGARRAGAARERREGLRAGGVRGSSRKRVVDRVAHRVAPYARGRGQRFGRLELFGWYGRNSIV